MESYLCLQYKESSGVAGRKVYPGTNVIPFNHIDKDALIGANLSFRQNDGLVGGVDISLPAGLYNFRISCQQTSDVAGSRAQLYAIRGGPIWTGKNCSEQSAGADYEINDSGVFVLQEPNTITPLILAKGKAVNGFGAPLSLDSEGEIYAVLEICTIRWGL